MIIPTYNHAQYLGDAIRSVLNQTYRNFEIIVVDDGSTDGTRELVATFGNQVCYIWQENRGLSAARNAGIHPANGELIALLDADDLYEAEFLATLVSILQSDSRLDGVYCSARTVDVENNALPQSIGKAVRPELFRETLLKGGFFPPSCMLVFRSCYQEMDHLFDESLTALEDWDMWLRFSTRYTIVGVDLPLVRYRVVPGSMSSNPVRMSNNRMSVLRKHFDAGLAEETHPPPAYRQAQGYSCIRGAIEFLQARDTTQATAALEQAFATWPKLVFEPDVFYELALGQQPMGYRGDFSSLDLKTNAVVLFTMLDHVFDDSRSDSELRRYRHIAYSNAFRVLGLLHYGRMELIEARRCFFRAFLTNPRLGMNRQFVVTLIKSFLGRAVLRHGRSLSKKTIGDAEAPA